jgi:hypothetical protein
MTTKELQTKERAQLFVMGCPKAWTHWPFLALVRENAEGYRGLDYGLLIDIFHATKWGLSGYSSTIFLCNFYAKPEEWNEILALPKEVFDTLEEVYSAGWKIDE